MHLSYQLIINNFDLKKKKSVCGELAMEKVEGEALNVAKLFM